MSVHQEDTRTQQQRDGGNNNNQHAVVVATVASSIECLATLLLGSTLLVAPNYMAHLVFASTTNSESLSVLRFSGGVLLSQGASCALLLSDLLLELLWNNNNKSITAVSIYKCRSSLASQAIMGITLVLSGLVNDRVSGSTNELAFWIGGGALFLVLACVGFMASFWPYVQQQEQQDEDDVEEGSIQQQQDLTEPLLTQQDTNMHGVEASQQLMMESSAEQQETAEDEANHNDSQEEANTFTSRLTGTRRLLKLAAPQVFYLYIGCAVLLVRLPFSLAIPHFVSTTLGALGRSDFAQARMEVLLLLILGTIDAALDFWCVFLFGYAKERIVKNVRVDTFQAILHQEMAFFDKHTSGDLSSRLNSDCGEMAGDLTWFFRFSIESVVRITGITMYMLIRSPLLGACALSIVPVVAIVNKKYGDWLRKNAIAVQNALAQANSVAQEAFSCVRTVVAFASEQLEQDKYSDKIEHQYQLNVRQLFLTGVYYMAISTFLINTCVQAALLLIGTALIQHGKLTPEILLAFMLYQGQLQNETLNLFQSYSSLIKSSGAGDKVFALLDRTPPPPGTGSPRVKVEDQEIPVEASAIQEKRSSSNVQLRNVQFHYPSRPSHTVLQGLNLNIPAGSTVALVGPSGCGKSTVIGLLQRFYDPTGGQLFVDGNDLRSLDIKAHRRSIATVSQDPVLFSGTILSNIMYASPTATLEDAIRAATLANAHDFIQTFPLGYDTQVGERGVQLSGGQKQRICIARAIIRNPSILLLDEATSALDAVSEQVVQEALDHLLNVNNDMTTVVVAHRLRTVRGANCIAFIENGRVVEQGTHEELMQLMEGQYRKMVERAGSNGLLPDT